YSGALNRFVPNPDLEPETLLAVEAGVTTRIGRGELQAVGFRHQLKDAVVRTTLTDGRFLRVNRDELESTGVELMINQSFGALRVSGDLTVQSVDLTDPTAGVTNRPENLPEVFGRISTAFPLFAAIQGRIEAGYIGDQFCIDPGTGADHELDAGTDVNVDLARTFTLRPRGASWFSRIETRISADNVGDTARYDQCGLPQPGRLIRFQVRLF
ncbi:MAG TPA: TonB-dependent receptor, partial [Longimicrobiales bacterium]|nr:TonB-dependent receptor [Longimicrobiales bacterium]